MFRAFTSLKEWQVPHINNPEPAWHEFDIAAFKYALTTLHQIEVKAKERKEKKHKIDERLCAMRDARERAAWKVAAESESDDRPDCRVLRKTEPGTDTDDKKLRGQRGLSLKRIQQLAELRRRCQSLNRSLQHTPGERSRDGASANRNWLASVHGDNDLTTVGMTPFLMAAFLTCQGEPMFAQNFSDIPGTAEGNRWLTEGKPQLIWLLW